MTKRLLHTVCFLLAGCTIAFGQAAPKPYGVLPAPRQLNWQETDMYCIIHFSMATYSDKEWGYGDENPEIFNPSKFSAEQIVGAAKAGGFKGVVIVAKHHDGFCLWPTKTTGHNISASPYKKGKGDIIKEYQLACQKLGMKLGIYCSPWDRNNANYGTAKYVEIYRAQLKELYSNYGPLFMSWHDGANGGDGYYGGTREVRKIDRTTYYGWDTNWAITRKMQPGAAIFGDVGPDVRWVGNEEGHAGETSWATYTPIAPEPGKRPANGYVQDVLGVEGTRNGAYWMPAECDVPLRTGWFYHKAQDGQSKSPYKLMDLYYKSVGRGACLDLGLSPDKDGVIADEDVNILKEFGTILRQTFAINLAKGATFTASNVRGSNETKFGASNLTDNSRYTYWATNDNTTTPQLTIDLHQPKTFNVIRLRENIKLGQRIEAFKVEAWQNNTWKQIAAATSIGANRLIRLPQNVTASKLRLKITKSPVCIALSDFGLFKEPDHLSAPLVTRNAKGEVSISTEAPVNSITYSIIGADSSKASATYTQPFDLANGGTVKAVSIGTTGKSEIKTYEFGPIKAGWNVTDDDIKSAAKSIDDNNYSYAEVPVGNQLVVDMGRNARISSFYYQPRMDKESKGKVDAYEFYYSTDGQNFTKAAEGEFSNIRSNPVLQVVPLKQPVTARYFKFIPKHVTDGSVAEIVEVGIY